MDSSLSSAYLSIKNSTIDKLDGVKIIEINHFFNTYIKYTTDTIKDNWQTPEETLERGAGDCEDLAIAKYFMALELGLDEEDLSIVYCFDEKSKAHMICLWKTTVMDNRREGAIEAKFSGLTPVYAFDMTSRFIVNNEWYFTETAFPLTKWEALLEKI
jgi:predicted transglutaminase-like cysteine proteinase